MTIQDALDVIKRELALERTPTGRSINEESLLSLESALEDSKNYHMDAIQCLNCKLIQSSLLVPSGCINCGSKDLTSDVS